MFGHGWIAQTAGNTPVYAGIACNMRCLVAGVAHRNAVVPEAAGAAASTGSPYAGFALGTDADGGAVVVDVIAGPAALAGLLPGDNIDVAAGEKVGVARLLEIVRTSSPGTRLPLRVIREGQVLELNLVVGDRAQWAAPSAYPARISYIEPPHRTAPIWPDGVEAKVASAAPGLAPERERIQRMFDDLAREDRGFNNLRMNRQALADPGTLVEWEHCLVRDMKPGAEARDRVAPLLCEILVLDCSAIRRIAPEASATPSLADFAQSIAVANRRVREALVAAGPRDRLFRDLCYLLEETATRRTLILQPDALKGIRVMQASMRVDFTALLDAFDLLIVNASHVPGATTNARRKIPAELSAMVEGEILDYAEVDGGYVVVGGPGPNRYRMDWLYAVIDTGNDDRYSTGLANGEVRIRHVAGNAAKGRDNSGVAIDESP